METFAVGEILKQVSWADEVITASHFRTEAGDEVDLVLETWDGRVAGSEIKAGTRIKDPDLNGLRLVRDRLGDRFTGGFVLNLGELAYRKESKIAVMPLSALWSLLDWRRHVDYDVPTYGRLRLRQSRCDVVVEPGADQASNAVEILWLLVPQDANRPPLLGQDILEAAKPRVL